MLSSAINQTNIQQRYESEGELVWKKKVLILYLLF